MSLTPKPDVTLDAQLKEAKRELALRRRVYPEWVRAKRLNVFKAEDQIALMAAIVKTLEDLVAKSKPL